MRLKIMRFPTLDKHLVKDSSGEFCRVLREGFSNCGRVGGEGNDTVSPASLRLPTLRVNGDQVASQQSFILRLTLGSV